jgi:hypothetical protein
MLELQLKQGESRRRSAERRGRAYAGIAPIALVGAFCLSPASVPVIAAGSAVTLDQLAARVTALEGTVTAPRTTVANIPLKPGPQGPAGLRGPHGTARAPADMPRVAALETKTQFLSAGGIASSISGGELNVANGLYTWVGGEIGNAAANEAGTVSGGDGNTASGFASSVSGGENVQNSRDSGWSAGSLHSP